jgi:hypothetical protein|tara:strand:- start:171 stop:350 length:180 start_codon:yes stop_codon:yes gene_type:complete
MNQKKSSRLISETHTRAMLNIGRYALEGLRKKKLIKFKVVDERGTRKYCFNSIQEFINE